jgi:hypothetical protein
MKNSILILLLFLTNLTVFCQTSASSSGKIWTESERENLLKGLERTKNEVFLEIKGLSEQQWNFKEDSTRWSISEIVEHLITQDESYTKEIWTCLSQPELPQFIDRAKGNDHVFVEYSEDPLKANAGFLSPFGRYCSKEKTEFAYNRIRNALFGTVKNSKDDFRQHFTFRNFKFDGQLTNAETYNVRDMHQIVLTCISHTDRHLKQLRKVKNHPKYPK